MTHAQEIRIGNCIKDANGKIRFVTDRIISDIASAPERHGYEPLELTAERLEKFGFVEKKSYNKQEKHFVKEGFDHLADYGGQTIVLKENDSYLVCGYYENIIYLKYVHQLQNLYYAIVGEELEVHNLK